MLIPVLLLATISQGQTNLFGNLEFGSYEVGIKQLKFVSQLNPDTIELNIHLWYPAKKSKKEPFKLRDYINYESNLDLSELHQEFSVKIGGESNLLPPDSLDLILNAPMKAIKNAKGINGKFPLLIWSSRRETIAYQCIISEYLASHGYTVAFAKRKPDASFPWELKTLEEKEKELHQQLKDINAAIKFLNRRKNIDDAKTGVISWSYAGESAILSQMNNPAIDVVIGLSAIGFSSGVYLGQAFGQAIDTAKINVPYLILFEKIGPNGSERTPPAIFDSLHPASRYVSFKELAHGNFNGIEGMIPGVFKTQKVHTWSKGGAVAQLGYETICKLTLNFLESIFNSDNFEERTLLLTQKLPPDFIRIQQPKLNTN